METSTEKPYFLTPLSNAMARAGQRVKLECEVTGNPIPRLSWTHDGKPIDETIHTKVIISSSIKFTFLLLLVLYISIYFYHAVQYICL